MIVGNYTYTTVTSGNTSVAAVAAAVNLRLVGIIARESSGTPALTTLNVCHGTANTTIIAPIALLATTTQYLDFSAAGGLPVSSGVYLERTAGNSTVTFITMVQ